MDIKMNDKREYKRNNKTKLKQIFVIPVLASDTKYEI